MLRGYHPGEGAPDDDRGPDADAAGTDGMVPGVPLPWGTPSGSDRHHAGEIALTKPVFFFAQALADAQEEPAGSKAVFCLRKADAGIFRGLGIWSRGHGAACEIRTGDRHGDPGRRKRQGSHGGIRQLWCEEDVCRICETGEGLMLNFIWNNDFRCDILY